MMDQVFFFIKGHEIYVGEYYKGQIKQVKFKEKDFWEVFDQHDFIEFIEHMNYPMNYNAFKDNRVTILYDEPQKYEMLYQVKSLFDQAFDVRVGLLLPYIEQAHLTKCKENQEVLSEAYVVYEQTYYKVNKVTHNDEVRISLERQRGLSFEQLEDIEQKAYKITVEDISKMIMNEEIDNILVPLSQGYPVLSPVRLYNEVIDKEKKRFLETHYKIDHNSYNAEERFVSKQVNLFSYTKTVNKMFGRKENQTLYKKTLGEGVYHSLLRSRTGDLWAEKGELIGVVVQQMTHDELLEWLKKIGFGGNDE